MRKSILYFLWLGVSLTTMFFYPLISTISDGLFYLQWQNSNTLELFLAFLTISSVLGVLLYVTESIQTSYRRIIITMLLCVIPFASFAIHISRRLVPGHLLISVAEWLAENSTVAYPLVAISLLVSIYTMPRYHETVRRGLIKAVLIFSPLTAFAVVTVLRFGFLSPIIEIKNDSHNITARRVTSNSRNIFVVLFDELDYEYLYEKGDIRGDYPNIKAFASISENYHGALSPGGATLTSMIGFLIGRQIVEVKIDDSRGLIMYEILENGDVRALNIAQDNIFSMARSRGFRTVMYGWLHPYCMMMHENLDDCRSFSIYNYSTINAPISLMNPIFTNIILWPHQLPFGLLKNPIYSVYQHKVVSETYDLAVSALSDGGPLFEFVHFSIPHFPFIYEGDQYRPAKDPFLQSSENYVKQLRYVDHLFGRFISQLKDHDKFANSDVVLVSDHGYRIMRKNGTAKKIPLIIKRAAQRVRKDIYDSTRAEIMLRTIVEVGIEIAQPVSN